MSKIASGDVWRAAYRRETNAASLSRFCATARLKANVFDYRHPYEGTYRLYVSSNCNAWGHPLSIHINRHGRLGNNVDQLINAFHLARCMRAEGVHVGNVNFGELSADWRVLGVRISPFAPCHSGAILSGSFFNRQVFRGLFPCFESRGEPWIARNVVGPLLRERWPPNEEAGDETLHIHMRAGDIFNQGGTSPYYVPPPLAYYRYAIEHFGRQHPLKRVAVVAEDERNPCLRQLVRLVRQLGAEAVLKMGPLDEAVGTLLGARNIVCSVGTFASAIAAASTRLRRIYFFRGGKHERALRSGGAQVVVIDARRGTYISPNSWGNSASQIAEMMSYPLGDLSIVARA